jgi:hypothetical protein
MKTGITILWASATLALAFANVPTATGQEKAVIKTGRIERVSVQEVQLRADEEEELPDSIIVYSPDGEKITKYVYLPDESYGQYTWENGAWKFSSASASTSYSGRYDWNSIVFGYEIDGTMKVWYSTTNGIHFLCSIIRGGYLSYFYSEDADFSTNYDANGNLTSFRVILSDGYWHEFTVTYNARNNPVSVELRSVGFLDFKANYEYNDYGYCTLFNSYEGDFEWKQTAEYDERGKILYHSYYNKNGETSGDVSYEYYDETHFSLSLYTSYNNNNGSSIITKQEWKYGTDGQPEAYYCYENNELLYYAIPYYPAPSGNIPVSAGSNVWLSGGQLYIAATANGAAQVYAVSGQLLKTVALTAGQTTATPLPRGLYIVAAGGKTWKVIL